MPRPKKNTTKRASSKIPVSITIRLPDDIRSKLRAVAEEECTSENALCARLISEGLKTSKRDVLADLTKRLSVLEKRPHAITLRISDDAVEAILDAAEPDHDEEPSNGASKAEHSASDEDADPEAYEDDGDESNTVAAA